MFGSLVSEPKKGTIRSADSASPGLWDSWVSLLKVEEEVMDSGEIISVSVLHSEK